MVTYSTNWMGPVRLDWFAKRGLTKVVSDIVNNEFRQKLLRLPMGATFENEEITEQWCGGRIDIRGLDEQEYYMGQHEYSLPIMHGEDWNNLSEFLREFKSVELVPYRDLIRIFEGQYACNIRWAIVCLKEIKES
jgi:hypothetical protein